MGLKEFLKPDWKKIVLFLLMLVIAPFPYFVPSESAPSGYGIKLVWGFPPLVSYVYDYLPEPIQQINAGVSEVNRVKVTYFWMPIYSFFIFLLSCLSNWIIEKIKGKYGIVMIRGFLWRKLKKDWEARKPEGGKKKEKELPKKKEEKPEETEELSEEDIREMSKLIREEEGFIKGQKKKLEKYLDEMNLKKLKEMGLDIKGNKILCSNCKNWVELPRKQLMKLLGGYGFDIIWEYRCPKCKPQK